MRSPRLAATIILAAVAACGGDGGSSGCVTAPCTTGGGGTVTTGFVTKTLSDGGTTYAYQVFVPANYNSSTASIPVVVFMHGSGEKGSDNVAQTNVGLGPVVKANLSSFPAIVVFPQAPAIEGSVGNEIFDRITVTALDKTLAEYSKADPKRVYLTGLSYGGIRGYEVAYRNAAKFAAWVPISASICGGCISPGATQTQGFQLAAQGLKTVPIWEFHGQNDTQVSVNDSYAIQSAFNANGDPYTLTVYPSGGHSIWDDVYARADLWAWVYQKTR
jgi:predicted peptidase